MHRASSGRARPITGPRLLCGAAVLIVFGGGVSASAQTSGLVAAYPFEDGTGSAVTDASGRGNTGSITGATWTTAGKFGNALAFNGGARVTISDSASLRLTSAMTLEAWVYPSSVTSAWRDVLYKGDDNYFLEATSSNGGVPWAGGTFGEVSGPTALPANAWTHLAVTYDGATLRLYVNGAQVSSVPRTGSIATSTNPLQIGGDNIYGQFFQGTIDEVRVYNVAVTQAQIQSDMSTPIGAAPPPPSDTQPPTVSLTAPGPGSTLTGSAILSASASDAGTGVRGVQFQIDGVNVGPAINVSPYSLSVSTAAFGNGTHSIGAYAWDGARNVGSASPVSVTFNNAVPGTPEQTGLWSGLFSWPLVAVHAHLLRTGKVLMSDGQGVGTTALVWDPVTNSFVDVSAADNIFCGGHAALGDGRILIAGGHAGGHTGLAVTNIFDPATQSWTSAAPMAYPRWYPTVTTLADGRVLVTEGEIACDGCNATIPEIYDPATNTWTPLPGADLSLPYYPHVFLLPDGRLYAAATSEAPIVTSTLDVGTQTWTVVESSRKDGGSSAMYLPGKIIKAGTSVDPDNPPPASASTAYVIDMTQGSPSWRQIASMAFRRTYLTLTLLPDGNVLATGGGTTTNAVGVANGVLPAEVWSPASETWTTLAAMHAPRLYHSTALLLPDARVLVAGGGRFNSNNEPTDQESGEIFAPPYLFKGPRPAITSAPAQLAYNQAFSVQTPQAASIAKVVLMGTASVTHAINMNQRYVPLTFTAGAGTLSVTAPASANLAPKGYYMLFIIDTNGVPSMATFVNLPGN